MIKLESMNVGKHGPLEGNVFPNIDHLLGAFDGHPDI
jgi:hypothetical protein